jgi:hypothetical protein
VIAKKRRRNLTPHESKEQITFVKWFRRAFPTIRFYAVPNGGNRNIVTAKRLKAEGVSSGVPDLCFPKWRLRIEMKRQKGGKESEEQKAWKTYLEEECGETVLLTKGARDAANQLLEWLKKAGRI